MECHRASLHFPLLDINFVSAQYNGNVLAYALEVAVPIGNILVCDSRGDVKHDDTTLALNVVAITETTKFLLSGSVPDVETDGAKVGRELQRVHFDTEGGDVFFLEFTSQVALDEGGFSSASITDCIWMPYALDKGGM